MKPYLDDGDVVLHLGDCVEVMAQMPAESVDAIVCDPPYGLVFMGRHWDTGAVAFAVETWSEALRVLKPGGHLLAFGGTRTFHRLTCAIEDAGFEIRDCLSWLYGSGFPKSLDVSKAIDKAAGAERAVVGSYERRGRSGGIMGEETTITRDLTAPATPEAAAWEGWGTALKPAWEPVVVARKPLTGTVAANVQAHGTGALNINGCRVEGAPAYSYPNGPGGNVNPTSIGRRPDGSSSLRRETPVESNPAGRWPANVVLTHHPDCQQVGTRRVKGSNRGGDVTAMGQNGIYGKGRDLHRKALTYADADGTETVTAWACHPECPVRLLDEQAGERPAGDGVDWSARKAHGTGDGVTYFGVKPTGQHYADTGGPSRFFATFPADEPEDRWTHDPASGAASPSSPPSGPGGSAPSDAATSERHGTPSPNQEPSTSATPSGSRRSAESGTRPTTSTGRESSPASPGARPTPTGSLARSAEPSEQTATTTTTTGPPTCDGSAAGATSGYTLPLDRGGPGASRTFYTAKASTAERDGATHPTVKPLALMRWLVRLVTPPGGVVLDPFAGSGTTLLAAREEGFRAIGIEQSEEYAAMAAHRLRQLSLFGELAGEGA